ncbi:MAG: DUF1244 domain-containing protein [Gammaproteobacteria bacterium]
MTDQTTLEIEAATFRRLRDYLREHTEVQNIDLMNLAGFCRNCLSKWYRAEAEQRGVGIDYEQAREVVYGMPYAEWKERYQGEASADQQAQFAERMRDNPHS